MSDPNELATKWNVRHRFHKETSPELPQAADVLLQNLHFLPKTGQALDLAAGRGGNAKLLHEKGLHTSAWDLSDVAMQALQTAVPGVNTEVRDVIKRPPAPMSFDVIVVTRFLDRSLCTHIEQALRVHGVLFYQTFTKGLSNPDFMLHANELLQLFPTLHVQWYAESLNSREAMLVASRVDC